MATEHIKVVIDDAEINQLKAELAEIRSKVKTGTGGTRTLRSQINDIRRQATAAGVNLDQLPTLNRELRLIGRLMPGFSQTSRFLFQLRRITRGEEALRRVEALRDFEITEEVLEELDITREVAEEELEKAIEVELTRGLTTRLALAAIVIGIVVNAVRKETKRIERERIDFENEIRRDTELTHRQFRELQAEQIGFATWLDQFKARQEDEGWVDAISNTVINKLMDMGVLYPKGGKRFYATHIDPGT